MSDTSRRIAAIIAVLTIILIVLLIVAGCGKTETETDYFFLEESSPRFTVLERQAGYTITVDIQTGVEYLWTSKGNVTPLIDHEGRPFLANGWRDAD